MIDLIIIYLDYERLRYINYEHLMLFSNTPSIIYSVYNHYNKLLNN